MKRNVHHMKNQLFDKICYCVNLLMSHFYIKLLDKKIEVRKNDLKITSPH